MGIQERRERERAARRSAVLEAARALVRERGFNGTTTKEIAERCELSEATLFWYFQNKDEILISLLFEGIDFMARGLDEIVEADAPYAEKLESLWRFFSKVRREHPEYLHVFTYLAHPQTTDSATSAVKEQLRRRSGANFRRLAAIFEQAPGGNDPRLLADLVWASFVGLMVLRDSRVNLGARPHPTRSELARAFDLLRRGVAPDDAE